MSNTSQVHSNDLSISDQLSFCIALQQTYSVVVRKFDHMGSMVGFTDFIILYYLFNAEHKRMRRTDLAAMTGLTPSGITRLLPPLEKLKLVEKSSDARDGRVSFVNLTTGGQRVLLETIERAEYTASTILPKPNKTNLIRFETLLTDMKRNALS